MVLAFHQKLYKYGLWTSYVLFIITFLGLWTYGEVWLSTIELMLNIYIALFLIYHFNPYTHHKMDEFGREIAFSAGILLLVTKGVTHILGRLSDEGREGTREVSEAMYEVVDVFAK